MRIGDMRRRVRIQLRQVTVDTFGQQVFTWSDVLAHVPASIEPLSGRELLAAQAVNTEITHEINVRFNRALADPQKVAAMRVTYEANGVTRYFNVRGSMNLDERNRQITLLATEGLNQQ